MKAYLDEIDDVKKVQKKESHGYSLFEANLVMCEQLKAQQESSMIKNSDTKKRTLAPSNLTERNKISVYPMELKKRPGEQLPILGLNKKINNNSDNLYNIRSNDLNSKTQSLNDL